MSKKKTSKKHGFTLAEIPRLKIHDEKKLTEFKPEDFFKNHHNVSIALFQSLAENDTEAFLEILDSYLRVNRTQVAKEADLSRSTVSLALSKKGNPTLKTIAKIVHEATQRR
jgi:probable addiction module antidote protein